MGPDRNGDRIQGTELSARRFLLLLLVASTLLVALVAWPLASALLVAAVLGVVLAPLQQSFARVLRGRPKLAATLIVLAVLILVIGPLVALSAVVVNEVTAGVKFIVSTVRGEGFEGLIHRLPAPQRRQRLPLCRRSHQAHRTATRSAAARSFTRRESSCHLRDRQRPRDCTCGREQ